MHILCQVLLPRQGDTKTTVVSQELMVVIQCDGSCDWVWAPCLEHGRRSRKLYQERSGKGSQRRWGLKWVLNNRGAFTKQTGLGRTLQCMSFFSFSFLLLYLCLCQLSKLHVYKEAPNAYTTISKNIGWMVPLASCERFIPSFFSLTFPEYNILISTIMILVLSAQHFQCPCYTHSHQTRHQHRILQAGPSGFGLWTPKFVCFSLSYQCQEKSFLQFFFWSIQTRQHGKGVFVRLTVLAVRITQ